MIRTIDAKHATIIPEVKKKLTTFTCSFHRFTSKGTGKPEKEKERERRSEKTTATKSLVEVI